MSESLEYQVKTKADPSGLKQTQAEMKKTGDAMTAFGQAATGLVVASTGMTEALKGNVNGLISMSMGAGMAWQAMSKLHPALAVVSIALAVAAPLVAKLQEHFRKTRDLDTFADKLKKLGLADSDLKKLEQGLKKTADALSLVRDNATTAADAFDKLLAAQKAVTDLRRGMEDEKLDREERAELANPNLSEQQRREIQSRYAQERVDINATRRGEDIDARRNAISNDMQREQLKQRELDDSASTASSAAAKGLDNVMAQIEAVVEQGGNLNSAGYEDFLLKAMKGDVSGALDKASLDKLFEDIPEKAKDAAQELKNMIDFATGKRDEAGAARSRADTNRAEMAPVLDAMQQEAKALFDEKGTLGDRAAAEKALIAKEAAAEQARAEKSAVDSANAALENERFGKLTDPQKLDELNKKVESTGKAAAAETDVVKKGQLIEELVQARGQRDSVAAGIEKDKAGRAEKIADHQEAIDDIRSARSTTAMDTQSVFQHMYDVKAGRSPDEEVAENTKAIKDHMEAVAKIMKEAAA